MSDSPLPLFSVSVVAPNSPTRSQTLALPRPLPPVRVGTGSILNTVPLCTPQTGLCLGIFIGVWSLLAAFVSPRNGVL